MWCILITYTSIFLLLASPRSATTPSQLNFLCFFKPYSPNLRCPVTSGCGANHHSVAGLPETLSLNKKDFSSPGSHIWWLSQTWVWLLPFILEYSLAESHAGNHSCCEFTMHWSCSVQPTALLQSSTSQAITVFSCPFLRQGRGWNTDVSQAQMWLSTPQMLFLCTVTSCEFPS